MTAWEANVRKVVPYVPGEQPKDQNIIKLNTNENPYPPAPAVEKVLREFTVDTLRKYPDAQCEPLVSAIAKTYHLNKDQVFAGIGSDDVIAMCFMTFFNSKKPILFPNITYSFYDVWAEMLHIPYEMQALDEQLNICKEDYFKDNGGIILPNPNAPTGLQEGMEVLEEIIAKNSDSIVMIDEAYVDFGGESVLPLIEKYDNLLVIQTFSKSRSLAGSRIGYAMGNPKLIKYLNDVKYSFNSYTMDSVTLAVGTAAIADQKYFEDTTCKIITTREWTKQQLLELGFTFPDSKANFIFATHKSVPAKEIFMALREAGIYVRYFDKPEIDNYLRITIGTPKEMEALIDFLKRYLENV